MADLVFGDVPDWAGLLSGDYVGAGLLIDGLPLKETSKRCAGGLVYLATPYSKPVLDDDGAWCSFRSRRAALLAANVMARFGVLGVTAISPIMCSHMMVENALSGDIDPMDEKFWAKWCLKLLNKCDAMIVPPIIGWDDSCGVWAEARWMLASNRPVFVGGCDE
ncbi:MAG: DUF1937 family protein [Gammaproteobacteria bacterium]|nr:DUF1937 family protein [Gammaproteobacteria bacterium]